MGLTRLTLSKRRGRPVFRKNPRIFPPAKSKLLLVREPRVSNPVEAELLSKWWSDYRLQMAAIVRDTLRSCFEVRGDGASESCGVSEKAFDEESIAINDKWNNQTKLAREHYYFEHFNGKLADLLQKRREYDMEEAQRMETLKAKLLSVKNCGKEIVTRENIDERIDEIMSSPTVQFNYAVSERGKIMHTKSSGESSL